MASCTINSRVINVPDTTGGGEVGLTQGHLLKNKRPCVLLLVPYAAGIITAGYLHPRPFLWQYSLAAVLLLTVAVFAFKSRRIVTFFVAVLAFLLAFLLAGAGLRKRHIQAGLAETISPATSCSFTAVLAEDLTITGPVVSREGEVKGRATVTAVIKTVEVKGNRRHLGAWAVLTVNTYENSDFRYGDLVECMGTLRKPRRASNPGVFDQAKWLEQKGIYIHGEIESPDDVKLVERGGGNPLRRGLWSLRRRLRRSLGAGRMDDSSRAFLFGMTIGERGLVSPRLKEALIETNSMHVLAISGLHVGVIGFALILMLRVVPIRQSWRRIVVVLALFAYAALLDFRAPAFRAAVMVSAFLISPLFSRETDRLNTLAFSAIVILLVRPLDLFTASFQLSFLVVFTLIMLARPFSSMLVEKLSFAPDRGFLTIGPVRRRTYSVLRKVVALLGMSAVAFAGTLPLSAYYFHIVNPLSVLSNAVVVALVTLVVPLGMLSAFVGLLSLSLAGVINSLNGLVIHQMTGVIQAFAGASPCVMFVKAPPVTLIAGSYFLIGILGFSSPFSRRAKAVVLSMLVAALALVPMGSMLSGTEHTRATSLDTREAGVHFIEIPGGDKVLIDTGGDPETVRYAVHPFLKSRGVNGIETLILTRLDEAHCRGLDYLLDKYRVKKAVVPEPGKSAYGRVVLRSLERHGVEVVQLTTGKGHSLSSRPAINVRSIAASSDAEKSPGPSLVLSITENGVTTLLLGSIGQEGLDAAVDGGSGHQKLILVSERSTISSKRSRQIVQALHPEVIVLNTAGPSDSGPFAKANGSEDKSSIVVLLTGRHGAVTIGFPDNRFDIKTMLPYNP